MVVVLPGTPEDVATREGVGTTAESPTGDRVEQGVIGANRGEVHRPVDEIVTRTESAVTTHLTHLFRDRGHGGPQLRQCAVLCHPDRSGGGLDRFRGLLRRETNDDTQHEDFPLFGWQRDRAVDPSATDSAPFIARCSGPSYGSSSSGSSETGSDLFRATERWASTTLCAAIP